MESERGGTARTYKLWRSTERQRSCAATVPLSDSTVTTALRAPNTKTRPRVNLCSGTDRTCAKHVRVRDGRSCSDIKTIERSSWSDKLDPRSHIHCLRTPHILNEEKQVMLHINFHHSVFSYRYLPPGVPDSNTDTLPHAYSSPVLH